MLLISVSNNEKGCKTIGPEKLKFSAESASHLSSAFPGLPANDGPVMPRVVEASG
jgi:hypothetical protein